MMLTLALAMSLAGQDIDPVQFKRCDVRCQTRLWDWIAMSRCLGEPMLK